MSGICGILYRDGRQVESQTIKNMNSKISHRGPDGSKVWVKGPVALGHQMLYTTPESLHEKLPWEDKSSGLVITADARIDNRDELALLLGIENAVNIPDSVFILKAYEKWGESCPEYLLGDFSFAIWDPVNEILFCARDHMGVKPFYYYASDNEFFFATEIKAILSHPEVPRVLNELKVIDYLSSMLEDREITFYQDIYRLPAAHFLIVDHKRTKMKEYWALDPNREIHLNSDEEYAEGFLNIFTETVDCRLRSAFPVGSFLSGGLDSSSIVCTARNILLNQNKPSLKTFSAIFDDVPESDEREFIYAVIDGGNLDPHFIHADQISPLSEYDSMIWHQDQAIFTPNLFIHWNIYKKANIKDVRIIMDGLDGDTTVSHGTRHLNDLMRSMQWGNLIKEINSISKRLNINPYSLFLRILVMTIAPTSLENFKSFLRGINNISPPIMQKRFVTKVNLKKRAKFYEDNSFKKAKTSKEYHHRKLGSGLIQFVLEVADHAAAAFSIEPRYPFFDKRLVEFCLALPTEQKLFHGWDRIIMRRAMKSILPPEVQWRDQKGLLGFNFRNSLYKYEKGVIKDIIIHNNHEITEYVDIEKISKIYSDSKIDAENYMDIWKVVTLGLWLEKSSIARPLTD